MKQIYCMLPIINFNKLCTANSTSFIVVYRPARNFKTKTILEIQYDESVTLNPELEIVRTY